MSSIQGVLKKIVSEGYVRIIPSIDIDSLIAAGIIAKYMIDNGGNAGVSLDLKSVIDDKDTMHLLIGFNGLEVEYRNTYTIQFDGETSISAKTLKYIDRISDRKYLGKWALIAGHYRLLDYAAEGFKGYEKELLGEYPPEDVEPIFGFRLWGFQRKPMKSSLYRTLYPFMPGISGNLDIAGKIGEEVPGVVDGKSAKALANLIISNLKIDDDLKDKLLVKIVGYVYMVKLDDKKIDSGEIIGSLMTFYSTGADKPEYIPFTVFTPSVFNHLNVYYEEYIDIVASESAMVVDQILSSGRNVVETDYIVRPELLIDILGVIDVINSYDKPITVLNNGMKYTCIRELVRLGGGFDEIVDKCDEYQLCRVEE